MAEIATTPETATATIDYEAEYKKVLAERDSFKAEADKQKSLKDKYATENAEYKRKETAQMSDDEKKAKELQDIVTERDSFKAELAQLKLEKECLANNFTAEETDKLIKGKFAVKDIADIIKARVEEAVKSAKAEFTKNSTSNGLLGNGTANADGKSDFQKRQESRQKQTNIVEL